MKMIFIKLNTVIFALKIKIVFIKFIFYLKKNEFLGGFNEEKADDDYL